MPISSSCRLMGRCCILLFSWSSYFGRFLSSVGFLKRFSSLGNYVQLSEVFIGGFFSGNICKHLFSKQSVKWLSSGKQLPSCSLLKQPVSFTLKGHLRCVFIWKYLLRRIVQTAPLQHRNKRQFWAVVFVGKNTQCVIKCDNSVRPFATR